MNWKTVLGLVVIAVFAIGVWLWQSGWITQKVTFICDDGKSIDATFVLHYNGVNMSLSDGRYIKLAKFMYGEKGTMYITKDGHVKFWNQGDTAFVTETPKDQLPVTVYARKDDETYSNCKAAGFKGVTQIVRENLPPKFSWTLFPQGGVTKVILNSADTPSLYFGGAYPGTCFVVEESSWKLLPNEVTGAVCLDDGKGVEVGIFKTEQGGYVAKVGIVEGGNTQTAGTRGNFGNDYPLY